MKKNSKKFKSAFRYLGVIAASAMLLYLNRKTVYSYALIERDFSPILMAVLATLTLKYPPS